MTASPAAALRRRLTACPVGMDGWKEFEDVCTEILTYLFVPPLSQATIQARTVNGTDRRDAFFPNRNWDMSTSWGQLQHELGARLILFEFKNYDSQDVTKEEVNQTADYLNAPMGKLAIICTTKKPNASAHNRRNTVYSQHGKVVLFLLPEHLLEMIALREQGDDPAVLVIDLVEQFYLQHE